MNLPTPIQTYFAAQGPQDGAALAASFAPDAIVHDEGHTHHGPAAIHDWWLAAKIKYRDSTEVLDLTEADGKATVRARVTGDFPGSPLVLTFTFGLAGNQISSLRIG